MSAPSQHLYISGLRINVVAWRDETQNANDDLLAFEREHTLESQSVLLVQVLMSPNLFALLKFREGIQS